MNIRFDGKVAVVFGAAGGIGEAIVTLFAEGGAIVYIADYNLENAKKISEKLNALHYKTKPVKVDVSKDSEVNAVIKLVVAENNKIDIVVNNAGIVGLNSYLETTSEEFKRLLDVNLIGVDNGTKAALAEMIKQNDGKIVNVSSFAGRHALESGFAHYGITKAGVIYLSQAAAYAGAPYNVNVNSICPGIIRSPMWEEILDSFEKGGLDRETSWKENLKRYIPLARGDQKAIDIAYSVAFLCSEYADHISGQALNVDGGASMN